MPPVAEYELVAEILNHTAGSFAADKRVAFWGYDLKVFAALAKLSTLRDSKFCMVSDWDGHHSFRLFGQKIEKPNALKKFNPDEIIVLSIPRAHEIYDHLISQGFTPRQIFLPAPAWNMRLVVRDPRYQQAVDSIPKTIEGGLSCAEVTVHLFDSLRHVVAQQIPGDIINLGVFQGWSMYFIAASLKILENRIPRKVIGFDTFAGFVRTGSGYDRFVEHQCGLGKTGWNFFKNTSYDAVKANLSRFPNIVLVKGDIRKTLIRHCPNQISLALFDMDDYIPTKVALEPIYKRLSRGGLMVFDHFSCHTLAEGSAVGQRLAMLEFLKKHYLFNLNGTNVFIR